LQINFWQFLDFSFNLQVYTNVFYQTHIRFHSIIVFHNAIVLLALLAISIIIAASTHNNCEANGFEIVIDRTHYSINFSILPIWTGGCAVQSWKWNGASKVTIHRKRSRRWKNVSVKCVARNYRVHVFCSAYIQNFSGSSTFAHVFHFSGPAIMRRCSWKLYH
jgi:hypothetical protein